MPSSTPKWEGYHKWDCSPEFPFSPTKLVAFIPSQFLAISACISPFSSSSSTFHCLTGLKFFWLHLKYFADAEGFTYSAFLTKEMHPALSKNSVPAGTYRDLRPLFCPGGGSLLTWTWSNIPPSACSAMSFDEALAEFSSFVSSERPPLLWIYRIPPVLRSWGVFPDRSAYPMETHFQISLEEPLLYFAGWPPCSTLMPAGWKHGLTENSVIARVIISSRKRNSVHWHTERTKRFWA